MTPLFGAFKISKTSTVTITYCKIPSNENWNVTFCSANSKENTITTANQLIKRNKSLTFSSSHNKNKHFMCSYSALTLILMTKLWFHCNTKTTAHDFLSFWLHNLRTKITINDLSLHTQDHLMWIYLNKNIQFNLGEQ